MIQSLMDSKFGIFVRLLGVMCFIALAHLGARVIHWFIDRPLYVSSWRYCGDAFRVNSDCDVHWYNYRIDSWAGHIGYHLGGCILVIIVAALITVLLVIAYRTTYFVMGWEWETYVDPCQNPKCPCERHVVEREDAERSRRLMTAAVVGGITGGIVGGGS